MAEKASKKETADKAKIQKPRCGIIMPISEIDGCSVEHWADVKDVLLEVIEQTEFEGDLVSNAGEIRIIHETIVHNIYNNEMIICDVSGKNPNVMFELGLRLAFDKPVLIVKDDVTNYSFDTSPIEHLEYPRDLNYKKINDFKILLKDKLIATHTKAGKDKNYSPFLKSFGQFKVAEIETKEVSSNEFIINELKEMRGELRDLAYLVRPKDKRVISNPLKTLVSKNIYFTTNTEKDGENLVTQLKKLTPQPFNYEIRSVKQVMVSVEIEFEEYVSISTLKERIIPELRKTGVNFGFSFE